MNDGEALLRAILSHPDEDTPRLVYADYLDEQGGRENADRAAFIRVQIKIARMRPEHFWCQRRAVMLSHAGGATLFVPRCRCDNCSLARRGHMVSRRYTVWEWCKGIPAGSVNRYYRGFVESVTCTAADWLAHADAIYWHPEQTVECPDCHGKRIRRPFVPTAHPIRRVTLTTAPLIAVGGPGWKSNHIWLGSGDDLRARLVDVTADPREVYGVGDEIHVLRAEWPHIEFTAICKILLKRHF